jgi:hypothetical protein
MTAFSMTDRPDPEFAKILELLNAFDHLCEKDRRSVIRSAGSADATPAKSDTSAMVLTSTDDGIQNKLAEHIAAGMAKRSGR